MIEPKAGYNAQYGFTTEDGAHPSTQVNVLRDLPVERVILALQRLKKIVARVKLDGDDDDTVGSKHTHCTWGLCSDSKELWPDAQDHIFPYDFLNSGRVSALGYNKMCPMQCMSVHKEGNGCFWSCFVFQLMPPDRETYLRLIDEKIAELEKGQKEK